MNERLLSRWSELQDSLWFLPSILTLLGAVLAVTLVQVDHAVWQGLDARPVPLIFSGGADGARGVLTAISGSLITVTATVFSITVVTLQLASAQMTPRVLRSFTGDRYVQFVLGVFIATFTYSLLVLRSVRSRNTDYDPFVPYIATTVAIALALLSVAVLIYFIHHVARSIQVAVVIAHATEETRGLISERFPSDIGQPAARPLAVIPTAEPPLLVRMEHAGYLQAIDEEALFRLARGGPWIVAIECRIGDFILPGAVVARVWPAVDAATELSGQIQQALVLGLERTMKEDLGLGVRQIVDIALKALSPGINDPTTAIICIDRLCELLTELARREPPARVRQDGNGAVLVALPAPSLEQIAESAFTQIRYYGAADPIVATHLVDSLRKVAELAPEDHRAPLVRQARLVVAGAEAVMRLPEDVARVARAAEWTREALPR